MEENLYLIGPDFRLDSFERRKALSHVNLSQFLNRGRVLRKMAIGREEDH